MGKEEKYAEEARKLASLLRATKHDWPHLHFDLHSYACRIACMVATGRLSAAQEEMLGNNFRALSTSEGIRWLISTYGESAE